MTWSVASKPHYFWRLLFTALSLLSVSSFVIATEYFARAHALFFSSHECYENKIEVYQPGRIRGVWTHCYRNNWLITGNVFLLAIYLCIRELSSIRTNYMHLWFLTSGPWIQFYTSHRQGAGLVSDYGSVSIWHHLFILSPSLSPFPIATL